MESGEGEEVALTGLGVIGSFFLSFCGFEGLVKGKIDCWEFWLCFGACRLLYCLRFLSLHSYQYEVMLIGDMYNTEGGREKWMQVLPGSGTMCYIVTRVIL